MSASTGVLTPSLVRTFVPYLVGYIVSILARHGLDINDDNAAALITFGVGSVYYAVVRFLEVYAGPKWGYILGVAKSPGYAPGSPPKREPLGASQLGSSQLGVVIAAGVVALGVVLAVTGQPVIGCLVIAGGLVVFALL